MKTLVKKNDIVIVNAGRSKGTRGRILRVYPGTDRVLVEGVNMITKATKADPRNNQPGGFVKKESSIHVSNLLLYCNTCSKGVKVKKVRNTEGGLQRICKKCGGAMDKGK